MSETQKITILKDTVCGSKPVKEGEIVDASAADARLLINLKKARETSDADLKKAKKASGSKPASTQKPPPKSDGAQAGDGDGKTGEGDSQTGEGGAAGEGATAAE